jgi:hypothetical protein
LSRSESERVMGRGRIEEGDVPILKPKKSNTVLYVLLGGIGAVVLLCGGIGLAGALAIRGMARNGTGLADGVISWKFHEEVNGIQVSVNEVKISAVDAKHPGGRESTSEVTYLVITLQLVTKDTTREYYAKGAAGSASLKDDFGNRIGMLTSLVDERGSRGKIVGQLDPYDSQPVRSDKPAFDKLVFARPVEAAGDLILSVDRSQYGGRGTANFSIPKEQWKNAKK